MKNIKAIYFAVADKRKQIFSHKEGFFFILNSIKKFMLMTFYIEHWGI